MSTIAAQREAFATALRTIPNLRADAYLQDRADPPAGGGHAMVDFDVDYDLVFADGADSFSWVVLVFAQRVNEIASQKFFDLLRDPRGAVGVALKPTIESNVGLSNVLDRGYANVQSASRPTVATLGTTEYLLVEFKIEVVT